MAPNIRNTYKTGQDALNASYLAWPATYPPVAMRIESVADDLSPHHLCQCPTEFINGIFATTTCQLTWRAPQTASKQSRPSPLVITGVQNVQVGPLAVTHAHQCAFCLVDVELVIKVGAPSQRASTSKTWSSLLISKVTCSSPNSTMSWRISDEHLVQNYVCVPTRRISEHIYLTRSTTMSWNNVDCQFIETHRTNTWLYHLH